jgi:hypothetical protein
MAESPLSVRVVNVPAVSEPHTDWSSRVVAGATTFLALFTLCVATATGVLARYTWRLWHSTSALVTGADATARRQLRAYVAVKDMFVKNVVPDESPLAELPIKNFGQTPAYRFSVSMSVSFGPTFGDVHPTQDQNVVLGHLAPSAVHFAKEGAPFTLSKAQYFQWETGTGTIFVHGIIRYVDTFDQPHYTCFRLKTPPGEQRLVSCGFEGNETDDDARLTGSPAA